MRGNAGTGPRDGQFSQGSAGPGLAEVLVVWALYGVWALCVFVTYSRVPSDELYHFRGEGLAGGASRVLVFLNWPTALMAIAVLALVTDRMGARARWPALLALALCLVTPVPGVIDQGDLDAKWINVVPAVGVAIVLAMTVWAVRETGIGGAGSGARDRARIVVVGVLALIALPWIFATVGFYIGDVPGLASIFRSKQVFEGEASVHLGEHHGFVGFMLIVTALLLTRELPRMRATRLRTALAVYLSGLIAYGLGNTANDAWLEQLVKRGWISWEIPDMVRPHLDWIWAVAIAVGVAIYVAFWRDSESA